MMVMLESTVSLSSFTSGVVMWHCGDTWMAVGFYVMVVVHLAVVGKFKN